MVDKKLGSWEQKLNKVVQDNSKDLLEVRADLKQISAGITTGVKDIFLEYESKLTSFSKTLSDMQVKLQNETQKRLSLEAIVKKRNVRLLNIPETVTDRDLYDHVANLFRNVQLDDFRLVIDTVFRSGRKNSFYPRATVVVLVTLRSKSQVLSKRSQFRSLGITVVEDLPMEWALSRKALRPVLNFVKRKNATEGTNLSVNFRQDKLEINGKLFSPNTLDTLPDDLSLTKIYTPMSSDAALFFTHNSPLSNHHLATFTIDDQQYNCSEQYIMAQKAKLFEDPLTHAEILREPDPKKQKALGKQVKNFKKEIWQQNAKDSDRSRNRRKKSIKTVTLRLSLNPLAREK